MHFSRRHKIANKTIRERTMQGELGCIIIRKRLTWLGHVARMNKDRRAKLVSGRKSGKGKAEKKMARDHPRRPERIETDVGRCSRRGGGQAWF